MTTNRILKPIRTVEVKATLETQPELKVKDLALHLEVNRQFMAGFLAALEERGEVTCRKAGPARIYFNDSSEDTVCRRNLAAEPRTPMSTKDG